MPPTALAPAHDLDWFEMFHWSNNSNEMLKWSLYTYLYEIQQFLPINSLREIAALVNVGIADSLDSTRKVVKKSMLKAWNSMTHNHLIKISVNHKNPSLRTTISYFSHQGLLTTNNFWNHCSSARAKFPALLLQLTFTTLSALISPPILSISSNPCTGHL